MGSFNGHINTGIYFVCFGIRWWYCVLMRYYLGRRETALARPKPRVFKNSLLFPVSCCPGIPIEAYALLFAALFEFTGEFVMGLYKYGLMMNGQHMTILFFFIVASFITILKEHKVITVPNLDYSFMILAFTVYGFILYYHTIHKNLLEAQLHINMVQMSVFISSSLAAEMMRPHSFLAACIRCLSFSVLGSWLIHIAFILYQPYEDPWDPNSPMHLKLAAMMFMWHLAGNLLVVFVLAAFVLCRVRSMSPNEVQMALDITYSNTTASSDVCYKSGDQGRYLLVQSDDESV